MTPQNDLADDDEAQVEPASSAFEAVQGQPEPLKADEGEPNLLDVSTLPGGARAAIEAVLMVVDAPVAPTDLGIAVGLPTPQVERLLIDLAAEYRGAGGAPVRGFELREIAGGWRIYSAPAYAEVVARFVRNGQTAKLTQASLETLAVIAYRQPISRGRISAVRGVNVDSVVRTLMARGLIEEAGQDEESGAFLYRTSQEFLERMGIGSLSELPPLAPYLPDGAELADLQEHIDQ